ncbi:helix-turn-helix transcriptional regulator [Paenibacillus wynnii]|uniref:Helix-turn-helix domain-containing protein n=1 Tax=Paenibacillus wynnii TaxID=268407 RepID=A0A098M2N3_9BACL|nr:helix-turn-helix domain-containing protein [Paenibacillus wynnii]KGE16650.1 hypothetical protein PWYN_18265 [Paenibacillus wynnii]
MIQEEAFELFVQAIELMKLEIKKQVLAEIASYQHGDLMTIPQMAERMQISERKAYEMRKQTGFPSYNFGERQIRVIWSEVMQWAKKQAEEEYVRQLK